MPHSLMIESPEDRRRLLSVARNEAERALGASTDAPAEVLRIEGRFGGVFVTLWRVKRLRGCIGTFEATEDVAATTSAMTRASLDDPRFAKAPVTLEELRDLTIEISILSEATPTKRPLSLVPGTHGVIVRRRGRSGCFLPKVCSERGWSAEEFLSNCCTMKAGLPAHAWRKENAEILLFTAQVFSESGTG